jgi:DNA-binding phage protein
MTKKMKRRGAGTIRNASAKTHIPFSSPQLKNAKLVTETLLECIKTGDLDAFRDVLTSHLMTANKMQLAKRTGLGRRTLYDIVDRKKKFNPELSTISAIIRGLAS